VHSLFEWEQPHPDCPHCQEEGLVPPPTQPPGDMHEPKPYTGELDWANDDSELVHPFVD
jgi:hypothetical protein